MLIVCKFVVLIRFAPAYSEAAEAAAYYFYGKNLQFIKMAVGAEAA